MAGASLLPVCSSLHPAHPSSQSQHVLSGHWIEFHHPYMFRQIEFVQCPRFAAHCCTHKQATVVGFIDPSLIQDLAKSADSARQLNFITLHVLSGEIKSRSAARWCNTVTSNPCFQPHLSLSTLNCDLIQLWQLMSSHWDLPTNT